MEIAFVKGSPALMIKREKLLVVGDLHLGRDIRLRQSGLFVANAVQRIARSLLDTCEKEKAKGIVLLGDVKESISYPSKEEYQELAEFFYAMRKVHIIITKGNHDPRMEEILKRLDANAEIVQELLLSKVALMHGHKMPSQEAMNKNYIITAHAHPVAKINGNIEKVCAIMKVGSGAWKKYKSYNKKIKLVIMPAFNELITGSEIETDKKFAPMLRNDIFSISGMEIFDVQGKQV